MRLTRRGWTVIGLVGIAIASGILFGPRGLNAVAAPGVVALLAAAVQVKRIEVPSFERELPDRGSRGDTITVRLHFETETPFSGRVDDAVDDGLSATGNSREITISQTTVTYDLHLDRRGERAVGPLHVEVRDVLGLVAETYRYSSQRRLLVHPRVHLLAGPRREELVLLYGEGGDNRQEFTQLRHYQRGDPLRDIHWPSSAKQPGDDLVVKEFTTDEGSRTVEVAAEATTGWTDAMADATASVVVDILEAGVNVGLTTPSGRVRPDTGIDHRKAILDHLARVGDGRLPETARARADALVTASSNGIVVDVRGRQCSFTELAGRQIDTVPPGAEPSDQPGTREENPVTEWEDERPEGVSA